jgi:O-acetyl-ADP-ribose deacetylase
MNVQFGPHRVQLVQGDITRQVVDAIVNAANSALVGGGGVDGAIHRAGGPTLMQETRQRYPLGCPTGDAVVTTAGNLSARYAFHAYRRCLELAVEHDCGSIAFPAISTGVYGYPIDLAAEHALDEVARFLTSAGDRPPLEVRFVLFDAGAYAAFARVLETMLA